MTDLITRNEIAKLINISYYAVKNRMTRDPKFPSPVQKDKAKFGNRLLYDKQQIETYFSNYPILPYYKEPITIPIAPITSKKTKKVTLREVSEILNLNLGTVNARYSRDPAFPESVGQQKVSSGIAFIFELDELLRYFKNKPIKEDIKVVDSPENQKTLTLHEIAKLAKAAESTIYERRKFDSNFPKPLGKRKHYNKLLLFFDQTEIEHYLKTYPINTKSAQPKINDDNFNEMAMAFIMRPLIGSLEHVNS